MKKLFLWALSALLTLPAAAQDFVPEASFYGENYWTPDTLGNHRAIVSVNTPASVAEAYIPWRRRDANPEQKGIIVINVPVHIHDLLLQHTGKDIFLLVLATL